MKRKLLVLLLCFTSLMAWGADKEKTTSENRESMAVDAQRPLHSEEFYQELLEAFCQKHFDERFKFKVVFKRGAVKYHKESLRVESVAPRDTRTDKIQGKLSYDYLYGARTCKDGEFTAIVKSGTEPNEYIIILERNGGFFVWNIKSTGEISFIYPE